HTNNKSWAIQPEVTYSVEGAKLSYIGSNVKGNLNLGYLNVPILVQYLFDNGFRLEAGAQIGFLVSAKSKINGGATDDVKKSWKSTNISIPVGIGYLTRYGLGFDARYNFGVSDISNANGVKNVRANTFQFGLFYQLSDSKMK
ncbi:MAG: porin family protein, partial [Ginsengibacter sp.]